MAICNSAKLIFSTNTKGSRKNSSNHTKGTAITPWRAVGSWRRRRLIIFILEYHAAVIHPVEVYLIIPRGALNVTLRVSHKRLHNGARGELHIVHRMAAQIGNVVHCALGPVVLFVL